MTTVFWIGETPTANNPVPNHKSSWDANWTGSYGGFDSPDASARRNYIPVSFVPRQNPFYCALPYNDVTHGQIKPEAALVIPWFQQSFTEQGQSVCKDRWLAIRKGNRTCYAQWEDCGPFRTDHFQYVFQNERPKPNLNRGAGLDVSPAVRDYLGLQTTDVTDWQFVEVRDVSPGPWRNYGDNNHFVIAQRQAQQNQQRVVQDTTDKKKKYVVATPLCRRNSRSTATRAPSLHHARQGRVLRVAQPILQGRKGLLQLLHAVKQRLVTYSLGRAKDRERMKSGGDFPIEKIDRMLHLLLDRADQFGPFGFHLLAVGFENFPPLTEGENGPEDQCGPATMPVTSATEALIMAARMVAIPPAAATPAGNRNQAALSRNIRPSCSSTPLPAMRSTSVS